MLIIANKSGQLANRIIVFAHCIAFSQEYNMAVLGHAFDEYTDFFEGPRKGLKIKGGSVSHFFDTSSFFRHKCFESFRICAKAMRKSNLNDLALIKNIHLKNDEEVFLLNDPTNLPELKSNKIIFLSGWGLRTKDLIEKHHDFITNYFTPLKIYRDSAEEVVLPLKNKFKIVVGIHIRRGDYKNFLNGKYFYELETYKNAMENIARIFGHDSTAFVICSNENIDLDFFSGLNVVKGPGHFAADSHTLSLCDYIAGPPSTFSMWASFYGQKPLWMIRNVEQIPQLESFGVSKI
jgi:hypothetical protein